MHKIVIQNHQRVKLAVVLDIPSSNPPFPLLLCLHGFGSTKADVHYYSELMVKHGVATARFDFQGGGESEGLYEDRTLSGFIDDAQSVLSYIKTLPYIDSNRIGICGHSMGAVTAIIVAALNPKIRLLIATSPSIDAADTIKNLYDQKDFSLALSRGYALLRKNGVNKKLKLNFFDDAKKHEVTHRAKSITHDFLVVGAKKDTIVPYHQIAAFCKAVPHAQLLTLENSDHNLETDWEIAKEKIYSWLQKWAKVKKS